MPLGKRMVFRYFMSFLSQRGLRDTFLKNLNENNFSDTSYIFNAGKLNGVHDSISFFSLVNPSDYVVNAFRWGENWSQWAKLNDCWKDRLTFYD